MTVSTTPAAIRLHAVPLATTLPVPDVVRRLAHRETVTAFAGSWSWGDLVTCDPVRTAPPTADPFAVLADVPVVAGGAGRSGAVGGGWFGFLDYAEPGVRPGHRLAWFRDLLRHDGTRWWFEALIGEGTAASGASLPGPVHDDRASADRRLAALLADLDRPAPPRRCRVEVPRWPDRDRHLAAVERCIGEIRRGEIFQANIATELPVRVHGGPAEAWARLAEAGPPARAALVAGADRAAVSASPELFLHRSGDRVRTDPIKGTRPRSGDGSDEEQRRLLAGSVKDAAENVMIVDLMRNDLSRVCSPGTVRVGRLLTVQAHPGVWHLVSEVHGRRGAGTTDADLLAAAFPPGSVTGAPKVRACEVIAACEGHDRGLFTGALGGVSPLAGLELNVAIRTLDLGPAGPGGVRAGRLGVGGGITVDSDPAEEWTECLTKAAPVLAALGGAEPPAPVRVHRPADRAAGLFETVAAHDGRTPLAGEHAARLRRSYLAVTGRPLTAPVESAISRAATAGHQRIRVDADPADPARVTVRAVSWPGPSPLDAQPGLVLRVRRTGDGESHKFADRRWLDAHDAAVPDGEEPLLTDPDGLLLESTRSAVVVVHTGRLWVPPTDGRILPSVGRRAVLDRVDPGAARIAPLPLGALAGADGMFLVNALRGIRWVREVREGPPGDGRAVVAWRAPDPRTRDLSGPPGCGGSAGGASSGRRS